MSVMAMLHQLRMLPNLQTIPDNKVLVGWISGRIVETSLYRDMSEAVDARFTDALTFTKPGLSRNTSGSM